MLAVDVQNISKKFGQFFAVKDLSFQLSLGQVLGIIGPNGSGKTTFLNLITGMIHPTSGRVVLGENLKLGMAIARKGFIDDMNVSDNLKYCALLNGANSDKIDELVKDFELDFLQKAYGKLSAGMKQRVSLAAAFLNDSSLILLDEPTNHLDIDSILLLRRKVSMLKQKGVAFILTSHVLSELEKICDKILFLKRGRALTIVNNVDLIAKYGDLENAYLEHFH